MQRDRGTVDTANLFSDFNRSNNEDLSSGFNVRGRPWQTNTLEESSNQLMFGGLSFANKIDFTVKSHLTDVTFIVEDRKIYAGRDFLSILSPHYFKHLLHREDFVDNNNEQIVMDSVEYEDFLEMLECLVDPSRDIKADSVEILLDLGYRYQVKCLVDRIECFLLESSEFSVSKKLLLADRYRLKILQTSCVDLIHTENDQTMAEVKESQEFGQLSYKAKTALDDVTNNHEGLPQKFEILKRVRTVPATGFYATGVLSSEEHGGGVCNIDLAGLNWKVKACKGVFLTLNHDRPTSSDWAVEGFVELTIRKIATETVNEEYGEKKEAGREEWSETKKYAFSFNNANRVGKMVSSNAEKAERKGWVSLFHITIYITSISGVRENLWFEFTARSLWTNAVIIVDGKKIHVNKQYLSTISPRFNELFSKKDEVELKNVQYKEFIEFLHWIYPSTGRVLSVSSIFNVMRTAQKYEVNFDFSLTHPYLTKVFSSAFAFLPEKLIFFFQFNFGTKDELKNRGQHWAEYLLPYACDQVKKSDLLAKMTKVKKEALLQYVNSRIKKKFV